MNRKNLIAVGLSMLCLLGASTIKIAANETNPISIQGQTTEASQVENNIEDIASVESEEMPTEEGNIEQEPSIPEQNPSEEENPPVEPPVPEEGNNPTEETPLPDDETSEEIPDVTKPSDEPITPPANETNEPSNSGGNVATSGTQNNPTTTNFYVGNTWYHPTSIQDLGYVGETKNAIKLDNFMTRNYSSFLLPNNPFSVGQCTWLAWSRFYQVYGFDSGARGNGKTNAAEIVKAHPDLFQLSSTPSAGAVFSMEKNTLYPEYGHVGFVEAFDGKYIWISEGNVFGGLDFTGNIWIHKVSWTEFKAQYPDVVFAVPKQEQKEEENVNALEKILSCKQTFLKQCIFLVNSRYQLKF